MCVTSRSYIHHPTDIHWVRSLFSIVIPGICRTVIHWLGWIHRQIMSAILLGGHLSSITHNLTKPKFLTMGFLVTEQPQTKMDNLFQRHRVGVDDFVLLENCNDKDLFLENLRKRFKEKIIYVSGGPSGKRLSLSCLLLLSSSRPTLDRCWFPSTHTVSCQSMGKVFWKTIRIKTFTNSHHTCKWLWFKVKDF